MHLELLNNDDGKKTWGKASLVFSLCLHCALFVFFANTVVENGVGGGGLGQELGNGQTLRISNYLALGAKGEGGSVSAVSAKPEDSVAAPASAKLEGNARGAVSAKADAGADETVETKVGQKAVVKPLSQQKPIIQQKPVSQQKSVKPQTRASSPEVDTSNAPEQGEALASEDISGGQVTTSAGSMQVTTAAVAFGGSQGPEYKALVSPIYPDKALRQKLSGQVVLRVRLTAEGEVAEVEVLSSSHKIFAKAAERALRQSSFHPYKPSGVAEPCWTVVPVDFRLAS